MVNSMDLYEHNKKVLLRVLNNLKTHNKVGVVQATGTGKGKLAAAVIETLFTFNKGAKALIIAPLRSILQNYKENLNLNISNVDYCTYQKLENLSLNDMENITIEYDFVILDEYHRCGAPEWIKKVKCILNNIDKNNCKVMGLTATPIRYLDNSRDMSKELFDNNIIDGVNLEEAISDGILPGFIYNACLFSHKDILDNLKCDLRTNKYRISDDKKRNEFISKIERLSLEYNNRLKIENIIKEGTKELSENQKWVIFCKDKNNLEEIKKYCKKWFNYKVNLFILYSDRNEVDNDKTLSEFRKVKEGVNVLLCINMLNEGVHIRDLNGVIMLRKTESPILFMQQLGRALEVGKDFQPIIFDLIGNYRGLKMRENELEKKIITPISIVRNIEKITKNKKNYVIVHNFIEDLDDVLNELDKFIFKYSYWNEEEDKILREYYEIGGVKLCQENGIEKDGASINHRARYLDLRYLDTNSYWKPEEVEILKKYYKKGGYKLCQEKGIDNKTKKQIMSKAGKLGLAEKMTNGFYTFEEDEIIKKYYEKGGSQLCQEKGLSNRTKHSISDRAKLLGLRQEVLMDYWTEEEYTILKEYYSNGGYKLCQEKGLNRPKYSICNKAARLGIGYNTKKVWTDKEDNIIRKYYKIGGPQLCQEKGLIHRTDKSIFHRARMLGIKKRA